MRGFISLPHSTSTLRELWQTRYLIASLVQRDLTIRYRQTWLGWLWAVFNPLIQLGMYYTVFGLIARLTPPDYTVPYTWVLLSGLVIWMLFSSTLNTVGETLLNNLHLIKKIYFPRISLTLASLATSLMDFLLALICLCLLLPLGGVYFPLAHLPLLLVCGLFAALVAWGTGCIIALARVRFRDFRHLTPLIVQGWFYATPVVWTPGLLPERWKWLMACNPLYGIVGAFRYLLLGGTAPSALALFSSAGISLIIAAAGYVCFVRFESAVADQQ
ncbi:ABC transporter permease [Citrobacter sp. FP75]|uniref:ABC transporter permease n=1 Tax=Citrobacter sp. FP75 TaxID=1852949 RepID=UPI001BC9B1EC|nr:ABC transporter permease [Citrobacter sp. FP75]